MGQQPEEHHLFPLLDYFEGGGAFTIMPHWLPTTSYLLSVMKALEPSHILLTITANLAVAGLLLAPPRSLGGGGGQSNTNKANNSHPGDMCLSLALALP